MSVVRLFGKLDATFPREPFPGFGRLKQLLSASWVGPLARHLAACRRVIFVFFDLVHGSLPLPDRRERGRVSQPPTPGAEPRPVMEVNVSAFGQFGKWTIFRRVS